jgi:hypothetical protein
MATQEEFNQFYETQLRPKLLVFEKTRRSVLKKSILIWGFGGILILLAGLAIIIFLQLEDLETDTCSSVLTGGGIAVAVISIIIIGIELFRFSKQIKSLYKNHFKTQIIGSIVSFVDKNLTYHPHLKISKLDFQASQLFKRLYRKKIDRWRGEDYFEFEGILEQNKESPDLVLNPKPPFQFSEVVATEQRGDYSHVIFKGLFFIFNLHFNFNGIIIVLPNDKKRRSKAFKKWLKKQTYQYSIKLPTPALEKAFVVYTDNPTMAHSLASTQFWHNLLAFRRQLKKPIYLSLIHQKMYLAIEVEKNLFETSFFQTALNFKILQTFFEYLQLGQQIVDNLIPE